MENKQAFVIRFQKTDSGIRNILDFGCDISVILVLISMRRELQNRLIQFAGLCIHVKRSIAKNYEGEHLAKQLIRSSTSAALNYGEAQGAESQKDFIHKQSILLKELRESYINLIIIDQNQLCQDQSLTARAIDECNQLISIFVTSIRTAKRNLESKK